MKINVTNRGISMQIDYSEDPNRIWLSKISEALDHAVLKREGILYEKEKRRITLELKRNEYEKKAKKILGIIIWSSKSSTKKCKLIINNIIDCSGKKMDGEKVLIGGIDIDFNKKEIYVGAFCSREKSFELSLKLSELDVSLYDEYD